MKVNLHNKFEIILNNKTIVAYNTLLNKVYDKISFLEQYTSHIAIGTGKEKNTFSDTKLKTYLKTFSATTEQVQSDISKGTLYIKKLVNIDENNPESFEFSELGLCSSDEFDPDIYNHVLLTDTNGKVVTISRKQGDTLQIRVTLYLELNEDCKELFSKGDNKFIRALLGDSVEDSDGKLYVLRGTNNPANEFTNKISIDKESAIACESKVDKKDDEGNCQITFSAEIGEGETEEALIIFANQVVMRLNLLSLNAPSDLTIDVTPLEGNIVEVDKNVQEIEKITSPTPESESQFNTTKYSKSLKDKLINLFDQPFTSETPRFVSINGDMIAFIYNSQVHLYKEQNGVLTKLNTTQMNVANIFKMFILTDKILVLHTAEPYFEFYDIVEIQVIKRQVNLTNYNISIYSYNFIDACATQSNDVVIVGLIVDEDTPVALRFTKGAADTYYDHVVRLNITNAKKLYSINPNPFCSPLVAFLTDTRDGDTYYLAEEVFESTSQYGKSSTSAYQLLSNTKEILTGGRVVLSQKEDFPYLVAYYYPNFDKGDDHLSSATKHYLSGDGDYLIYKNPDGTYKINNFHITNVVSEFTEGFPSYVNFETVKDFVFLKDILLVFTSAEESVYGIQIKKSFTRLDNVKSKDSYNIKYKKYDLIGSRDLEGVKVNLCLNFGKTNLASNYIKFENGKPQISEIEKFMESKNAI